MKKRKKGTCIIYANMIAPLISNAILMIFMFFPSVQYSLDSDKRKTFSLWGLLGNSWEQSRHYLFSASVDRTSEGELFYKAVFVILITVFLLFLIGLAISLWASIVCLKYYSAPSHSESAKKARDIFTAVIPNRIVLSVPRILVIPLTFFPEILVILYRRLLLYNVSVDYKSVHYGLISVILFIALTVITAISAKHEKRLGMNVFAKSIDAKEEIDREEYQCEEDNSTPMELRRMSQTSAAEQTAKLRDLLGYSEDGDDDNENI